MQCLVAPLKIWTLSEVFYTDLHWLQLAIACFPSTVIMWDTVCFSTQMWPEIVVSRVLGEVEHQVNLFDKYFTKKSILQVFQACHSLTFMYCSWNKYCLCYLHGCGLRTRSPKSQEVLSSFYCVLTTPVLSLVFQACYHLVCEVWLIQQILFIKPTQMWAWDCGVQSPRRNFTLKSSIFWNYTVQIRFYSIFSLHPACEVSTVFIVVEYTQNGLITNIQNPEMPRSTKNFACVVNTSVLSRYFNSFTRIFKFKCRNGGPKPTVYSTSYKSGTTFSETQDYAIYWRAKDELDC